METPFSPLDRLVVLPSFQTSPGVGVLPVHAFLLRGSQPVLIDAGLASDGTAFLEALDSVVALSSLSAVVVTHEDADHTGALEVLLERAPQAKLVTTRTGAGKLAARLSLSPERLCCVAPGQRLDAGGRSFRVLRAPMYDSPATFLQLEEREGLLFSSDAFGAFIPENVERIDEIDRTNTLDGLSLFCRANSPWLARCDRALYERELAALQALGARWLFASHLPPATGPVLDEIFARARALPDEGEVVLPTSGPVVSVA
jgi:glyoxylase-like metal-dependent hydrolase (beta-lactamase superfamily II)